MKAPCLYAFIRRWWEPSFFLFSYLWKALKAARPYRLDNLEYGNSFHVKESERYGIWDSSTQSVLIWALELTTLLPSSSHVAPQWWWCTAWTLLSLNIPWFTSSATCWAFHELNPAFKWEEITVLMLRKCYIYRNQNFPSAVRRTFVKEVWWHWPAVALGRVSAGVTVPQAAQRGRAAARGVPGPPAHALYRAIGAVLHLLGPAGWQAAQGRGRRRARGWRWTWGCVWRELGNVQVVVTVGAQEHTRCSQSAPAWLSVLRPAPARAHRRCCRSLSERHWGKGTKQRFIR